MDADKPHDALFKRALSDPALAASELRAALGEAMARLVDWSTLRLVARGRPGPGGAAAREPDLLFAVKLRPRTGPEAAAMRPPEPQRRGQPEDAVSPEPDEAEELLVLVVFEHQSTSDPRMPLRLLQYMVTAWDTWARESGGRGPLPAVIPLVLAHPPGGWTAPAELVALCGFSPAQAAALAKFVPSFAYAVDDLSQATRAGLLGEEQLEPALRLVLWVLRDGRGGEGIVRGAPLLFALLEQLAARASGPGAVALDELVEGVFRYLHVVLPEDAALDLAALAEQAARQYPQAAQVTMNSLQKLVEQGRQEGRQEGLALGSLLTSRRALVRLLYARFGPLSPAALARIETLEAAELDDALLRVLTADGVDAVLG